MQNNLKYSHHDSVGAVEQNFFYIYIFNDINYYEYYLGHLVHFAFLDFSAVSYFRHTGNLQHPDSMFSEDYISGKLRKQSHCLPVCGLVR